MVAVLNLTGVGVPAEAAQRIGITQTTKAGAGTAQAGATAITSNMTLATTAGGATAFVLPSSIVGSGPLLFFNSSSTAALVFPPSGGTIQGGSADASFSVAQNKLTAFFKISSGGWGAILSA